MARLPARPGDNAPTWLRPSARRAPRCPPQVSSPALVLTSFPVTTCSSPPPVILSCPHLGPALPTRAWPASPSWATPNLTAPFSPLQLRGRFPQNLPVSLDHAPHLQDTRPFSSNPTLETRPTSHIRAPRGTGAEDLPAPPTQESHWNPHLHPQDCPASPTPPLTPPPSSGAQVPVPGGQSGGNLGCGLTPPSSLFSPPVSWTTMMRPR